VRSISSVETFDSLFFPHVIKAAQVVAVTWMEKPSLVWRLSLHSPLSGEEWISQGVKNTSLDHNVLKRCCSQELVVCQSYQTKDWNVAWHSIEEFSSSF